MPRHAQQPRATTATDATTSPIGDVVDRSTGLPRLLTRKCETCIFRPGNLMHLTDGTRDDVVRAALANDSWIVCHRTLPGTANPVGSQAICRGFWDVHARDSFGCRLAVAFGGPVLVPPPSEPTEPNSPHA
ncbi:hypothetical protein M8542_36240 [Amycolatopsis sp. OK19-0408]|uniref:Uncharacterized protein n=1 Tax=Amycolatopsis iheyensis TaxID=2945988 RepID=A0A9X2NNI7_9PSEU|nr:hypothetical protein [Amycolatopsis iheyensis]MCR6488295.1 hypothetical protein [Amycolatopsis iheyensis]